MIPVEKGGSPTPLDLLRGLDYVRAAAWIVARLADGLQHAHQRGVLHHDIKPSNILLGSDGQPMLLDFNLAGVLQEGQSQSVLGGTVAYLAPEHLRALGSRDPQLKAQVDRRSDVYSLGMVLFELLTGQGPFTQKSCYSALAVRLELMAVERNRVQPSVRQKRPDVPWSLESIVRKCLAPDPAQRYQQAAHLAIDLRRFLEDLPLSTAPELSFQERVLKWVRRHPQLTSSASVALVAAALLGGTSCLLIGVRSHLAETQRQLEVAQALERKRGFEEWTRRALCLMNTTSDLGDHQQRGRAACLKALSFYRVLDQDDWQQQEAWRQLSAEDRSRLGEDARELLLLLAANRARSATEDPAALREALSFLDKAESIVGLQPSRALYEDRALYLEKVGDVAAARAARALAGVHHAQRRPRPLSAGRQLCPQRPLWRGHRRTGSGSQTEPAPLLVVGPARPVQPGAGAEHAGGGGLRSVHRPVAGVRPGALQPRLQPGPGRRQGRRHPRLHGGAGDRPGVGAGVPEPRPGSPGPEASPRGAGRLRQGYGTGPRQRVCPRRQGRSSGRAGNADRGRCRFRGGVRAVRQPGRSGRRSHPLGVRLRRVQAPAGQGPGGLRRDSGGASRASAGPVRSGHAVDPQGPGRRGPGAL